MLHAEPFKTVRLRLQVCLAGSMQEDDCAAETHSCWVHTEGKQSCSACKDTFRGYVCKCPEGAASRTLIAQFLTFMPLMAEA